MSKYVDRFADSPLRKPTPPEKLEEVRSVLQLVGEYRVYQTAIRYDLEEGWQVIHGTYVRIVDDLDQAHRLLLYYRERRCTSCGGKGCPHDLSGGRKTLLVEALPQRSPNGPS